MTESSSRSRYFTPAEAAEVLPLVLQDLREARRLLIEGRGLAESLGVPAGVGPEGMPSEVRELQVQIHQHIDAIEQQGVDIKGLEPGLLDFPALRYGLEVYLCWREGEESIGWWHPIPTGMSGRQPLAATPDDAWEWCN